MDGENDGAFLSPVSSLRRAEEREWRAQQERIRAVPLSRHSDVFSARAKRKQARVDDADGDGRDTSTHKRRRSSPARFAVGAAPRSGAAPRYLSYERPAKAVTAAAERRTPRELSFSPVESEQIAREGKADGVDCVNDKEKEDVGLRRENEIFDDKEEHVLPLFSRYKDPTVRPRKGTAAEADATPAVRFNVETATQQELYRQLYGEDAGEDTWNSIQHDSMMDGMVDLSRTPDLSRLETVEGSEIFDAIMAAHTPRVGRLFPAEVERTESDKREHAFFDRRLIAQRKKYSLEQMTARWESDAANFGDELMSLGHADRLPEASVTEDASSLLHFRDSPIRVRSPVMSMGKARDSRIKRQSPLKKAVDEEAGEEEEEEEEEKEEEDAGGKSVNVVENEDDSDAESTEALLSRLREIKDVTWRYFLLWFIAGSLLLCTVVVTAPYMRRLSEPRLPFCDSPWTDVDSETRAISSIQELTQASALQPYVAMSALVERPSCQPCPLYGNCVGGDVISCSMPYELHNGVCVENPDVRKDLTRIASGIEQFIVARVTDRTCQDISVWAYMTPALLKSEDAGSFDLATPVQVLISELRAFVTNTVRYGSAVLDLPRDYVFHRALVMALRDLRDVFVGGDIGGEEANGIIYVGTALAPWTCQAQHRLYSHVYVIGGAIALSTLVGFWYIRSLTARDQRQLIDRLYKEALFALLHREGGPERWYPVDRLCEDLLDAHAIPPLERRRLRDSTWPKVVSLLLEDPRVWSQTTQLRGKDTLELEWAPSSGGKKIDTSPDKRRNRRRARMSLPARMNLP